MHTKKFYKETSGQRQADLRPTGYQQPFNETTPHAHAPAAPPKPTDQLGQMMAWEDGQLNHDETVLLFAELVKSGLAWTLQGMYGRQAASLIKMRLIDKNGNVLR